ncbi:MULTISPECIES: hypothetical protein [Limnospira]|uniref:hypothetical protein n=1 Tax=Limnospira TaxID=2596745 RepID=UPI0001D0EDF9|nr:hypothetical protein [Arthrospira platensis]MDF2212186.1 hypothetical protein [Arthrospira platensis NCB002]MDT9185997.1 hypothetical protein [Limnospira sp. PMC 289.06]MDT9298313.1 hypothetical protein [Arthrospira platensis PCC 7345]MDT9313709.1 hypothetical protein [Limnospira sp. Paracas R14]QQW27755.1 hypothetical protein AP9108_21570 [Arthrospira sp. PCC 9108]BAI92275.1 hypothetical protein NIES39_L01140 [Arthrospira platensis NIES-39]
MEYEIITDCLYKSGSDQVQILLNASGERSRLVEMATINKQAIVYCWLPVRQLY